MHTEKGLVCIIMHLPTPNTLHSRQKYKDKNLKKICMCIGSIQSNPFISINMIIKIHSFSNGIGYSVLFSEEQPIYRWSYPNLFCFSLRVNLQYMTWINHTKTYTFSTTSFVLGEDESWCMKGYMNSSRQMTALKQAAAACKSSSARHWWNDRANISSAFCFDFRIHAHRRLPIAMFLIFCGGGFGSTSQVRADGSLLLGRLNLCTLRARFTWQVICQTHLQWELHCQSCPLSAVLLIIFMDRISMYSQVAAGVRDRNLRTPSLLFADGVVLLASSNHYLQPARSSSAPPSLRAWFPVRKGWTAHSLSARSCCHKWSSSSVSESCLRVMAEWKA